MNKETSLSIVLKIDRLKKIEGDLVKFGSVLVNQLSDELNVTQETIRRDLETLEKQKKLKRIHGGAYLPNFYDKEVPIHVRKSLYNEEKQSIALKCLSFVQNGDTIILDSSTTALQLATLLDERSYEITILTNSLSISHQLENSKTVKLICLGGLLRSASRSFVGYVASNNLSTFYFDKCFVSCSTINPEMVATDNSEEEAMVRKLMFKQAKTTFLIADHTKFSASSTYKVVDLSEVDYLIIDQRLPTSWNDLIEQQKITVIYGSA